MKKIVVIGDSLEDKYIFFKSERREPANLSIPIGVRKDTIVVPGGAGNLHRNIESLLYREKIKFFTNSVKPKKVRYIVNNELVLREDIEDKIKYNRSIIKNALNTITEDDVVIISNYHKGFIKDRDIKDIIKYCDTYENVKVIIDTNIVNSSYANCFLLKINNITANEYCNKENLYGLRNIPLSQRISREMNSNVIVTAAKNKVEFTVNGVSYRCGFKNEDNIVFQDAIGAGDAFLVGFIYSYINEENFKEAVKYADSAGRCSTKYLGTIKQLSKFSSVHNFMANAHRNKYKYEIIE